MSKRMILGIGVVVVVAAFGLGHLAGRGTHGDAPVATAVPADAAATVWTCSMHPQIKLPHPGKCPICFMDLIPLVAEPANAGLGPRDLVLSPNAAALAEIETTPVRRAAATRNVDLVGKIAADETRTRVLTARVAGRLDRLHVDVTGQVVREGQPLAEIYSPRLFAAHAELIAARQAADRGEPGAAENLASVRERLHLLGLPSAQIDAMETASASDHVTLPAPLAGVVVHRAVLEGAYVQEGSPLFTIADLSQVWVELQAYESDLAWLHEGQSADFTVTALPGRTFHGTVVLIDPVLDPTTRTVRVRLNAANPDGSLKPGMLVRGRVMSALAGAVSSPLLIPATAPLLTGKRAVVYVRLPGDEPHFQGREVTLGPRTNDGYVVLSGLREGEQVVTHGAFKIDSALQILARPSMMSEPSEEEPQPMADMAAPTAAAEPVPAAAVDAYLALQAALAGDDDGVARDAARRLTAAIPAADLSDLDRLARATAEAADLAARREAFSPLSDRLWGALSSGGWQGDTALRRFHCPMAFDSRGADWVQTDTTTANPYYGATMLRCGSETAVLTPKEH